MEKAEQYEDLYVGAHLDDVALSCALRLLQTTRQRDSATVATIFSKGSVLLPDFYEHRRDEEKKAMAVLGIRTPIWLGFNDAPFRNYFYWSLERILLADHPSDETTLRAAAARVISLCERHGVKRLFLPLAVGTHIDHRLTHRVWSYVPPEIDIVFYEDRPYVFLPHSLTIRMSEIAAEREPTQLDPAGCDKRRILKEHSEGLRQVNLYKHYVKTKRQHFRLLLNARRQLEKSKRASLLKLSPEIVRTDDRNDIDQIEGAISCYKSQVNMLFETMPLFRDVSESYAQSLSANSLYAERYWLLNRS